MVYEAATLGYRWPDGSLTEHGPLDELRDLAAARDKKRDIAALTMNMAISAARRPDCVVCPSCVVLGDSLAQPSPLKVVPTVTNGGNVPPGDATIAPYGATAGQEG